MRVGDFEIYDKYALLLTTSACAKFTHVVSDEVEKYALPVETCLGAGMDSRAFSSEAKNDGRMCAWYAPPLIRTSNKDGEPLTPSRLTIKRKPTPQAGEA